MTEFAKRLQYLMDKNEMRAIDIAEASKGSISKANISQWLKGLNNPSQPKLQVLAQIFNVNPVYLMCLTDDPTVPDAARLSFEAKTCDLILQCYGKQSYEIVKMYVSLNPEGRVKAYEYVRDLAENPRYIKNTSHTSDVAI